MKQMNSPLRQLLSDLFNTDLIQVYRRKEKERTDRERREGKGGEDVNRRKKKKQKMFSNFSGTYEL